MSEPALEDVEEWPTCPMCGTPGVDSQEAHGSHYLCPGECPIVEFDADTEGQRMESKRLQRALGRDGEPVTDGGTTLQVHEVFELLANERRLRAMQIILDREPVSLGEIATQIAREEGEYSENERPHGKDRKRVYISLYQNHLEQLTAAGVVDGPNDALRSGPNASLVTAICNFAAVQVGRGSFSEVVSDGGVADNVCPECGDELTDAQAVKCHITMKHNNPLEVLDNVELEEGETIAEAIERGVLDGQ